MATTPDKARQLWLLGILLALAAVAVAGERSLRPPPRLGALAGPAPVAALQPLVPYLALDSLRTTAVSATPAPVTIARDPFHPSEVESRAPKMTVAAADSRVVEPPRPSLNVSAILISDSRRAAVIDDVIVNLGGALPGGGHLTAVERDHVVVTDAKGARRTININSGTL